MSAATIDLMDLDAFVEGREHELFARLREEDPLHWNDEPAGGPGFWSLTRYEDVRWAGRDKDGILSSAEGTQIQSRRSEGEGEARSLINLDDPEHKKIRQVFADHFTRAHVESTSADRARAVVDELLDRALEVGECDWVDTVSVQLPLLVFGTWLGVDREDLPRIVDWVNVIGGQEDPEYAPTPHAMEQARAGLFAYFTELDVRRRQDPRDDLVSLLANAEVDGRPLSLEARRLPTYQLLAFAGNDTTRNLVSWGVHEFSEHPGEWEALKADPQGRISDAIEELLRYATPVHCMRRVARQDIEMHGKTIREGDKVVLWWTAACRDPEAFDDPDRFDITRSPNRHVAFGWGRHFCLGSHLARLEAEILFTRIIERGIEVEVLGPPDRLRSNFFRGVKRLPVRVTQGTAP